MRENSIPDNGVEDNLLLDLIVGLNSARRTMRSYPQDHPVIQRALARVLSLCDSLLQTRQEVVIGIARGGVMIAGRCLNSSTVYTCFAETLFQRGIGVIVLHHGLEAQDLVSLISVINLPREEVLARGGIQVIWGEPGGRRISLVAIRYELFRAAEVAEINGIADGMQVAVLWEEYLTALTSGRLSVADARSCADLAGALLAAAEPAVAADAVPDDGDVHGTYHGYEWVATLSVPGWPELAAEPDLLDLEPERVEDGVENVLLFMLNDPDSTGEDDAIEEALCQAFRVHLETGQLRNAARIVREAVTAREALQSRQRLLDSFASFANVEQLLAGLRGWGKRLYPQAQELIALLGRDLLPPLLHCLAEEQDMQLRKFIMDRVIELGPSGIDFLTGSLQDSRWYFQRNLLLILREIGDPSTINFIRPLLRHRNRAVRQEALRTLLQLKDPVACRKVARDLDDGDSQTRLCALRLCSEFDLSAAVLEKLTAIALKGGFTGEIYQEREGAVAALAETGRPEAVAVITQILLSRNILAPRLHSKLKDFSLLMLERHLESPRETAVAPENCHEAGEVEATASAVRPRQRGAA